MENLRALAAGPERLHGTLPATYFRYFIEGTLVPARALALSVLLHVLLWVAPFPAFSVAHRAAEDPPEYTHVQLTYYGPIRDLPALAPAARKRLVAPPADKKTRPRIDAFHLRQTIVSAPKAPNHPRQTLIQPAAPNLAPKILPPLPNIVQWSEPTQPRKPRLRVRAPMLGKARSKSVASAPDLAVPAVPNAEKNLGELNIASSEMKNLRPRLAVNPMSVPQAGPRRAGGSEAAPQIGPNATGENGGVSNIIALSATPAPPAPVVEVPAGNLRAPISISPEGPRPGTGAGTGEKGNGGGGAAAGPPEISISAPKKDPSSTSGLSPSSPGRRMSSSFPARPEPRAAPAQPGSLRPVVPANERIKPGATPEQILGSKRVYQVSVNAPNLTSVTGSWVLHFAELSERDAGDDGKGDDGHSGDLSTPVPTLKVDPRYPPVLVRARVEGEVVLYAIIRKDGSVDSLQVLHSVEPQLDRNAMEALSRWKFRPAERNGQPVDVEAIVHIPFRAMPSNF